MSVKTLNMTNELYQYYLDATLRDLDVLKKLREETSTLTGATMQISPEQGQFMMLLIELIGAKKTLDIGTFTGYSSLVVALALPDDGRVVTCDISNPSVEIARKYWQMAGVEKKIDSRVGPAANTLQSLIDQGEAGTFDFAFIDADKNNYDAYYELCLQLLRKGGLIAVDNVLWGGDVADPSNQDKQTIAIRQLNEKIVRDERVTMSMLPIGDGLTLVIKR